MKESVSQIKNTLIHLADDAQVHAWFAVAMGVIEVLQVVAVVTDPDAHLHAATSWAGLNDYLPRGFAVLAGTLITGIYVLLLAARVYLT
jgi:hypothetical protein